MKDLLEVCCELDVHKEMIAACLLSGSLGTEPKEEVREFSTLLSGLEEMREWLKANNCRDIAMESTGVYWFPIYNVLEAGAEEDFKFNITVANPYHMKNVPGKKQTLRIPGGSRGYCGRGFWSQAISLQGRSVSCVTGRDIAGHWSRK